MPNAYFIKMSSPCSNATAMDSALVDTNSRIISPAALQRANDAFVQEKEIIIFRRTQLKQ